MVVDRDGLHQRRHTCYTPLMWIDILTVVLGIVFVLVVACMATRHDGWGDGA